MIITKKYRIESGHRVRDCSTRKCSFNFHGHSYVVEVSLRAEMLDCGGMVYDFGLFGDAIKPFVEMLDHTMVVSTLDATEIQDFFMRNNERWILVPFNPSAEWLSIFLFRGIQQILDRTETKNGEDANLRVEMVKVHETESGSATATLEDVQQHWRWPDFFQQCTFSPKLVEDAGETLQKIMRGERITNPEISHYLKPINYYV